MSDIPFMEQLNRGLREEERIFKLKEAVQLKNNILRIDLLVNASKYDAMLDDALKSKIDDIIREILPAEVNFKVNFVKTITEQKYIVRAVMDYIYANAPMAFPLLQSAKYEVDIKGDIIYVNIVVEKYISGYLSESGLCEKIAARLDTLFIEQAQVTYTEIPNVSEEIEVIQARQTRSSGLRVIKIDNLEKYSGTIAQSPRYICDVLESEHDLLTVCGAVSNVRSKYIEKIDKTIYSFTLNDTTGTIAAKYFAKVNKKFDWNDAIKDGETLVVSGEYRYDTYENRLLLNVKCIAKCLVLYNSIDVKSNFFTESEKYINIFPAKYLDAVQYDFFTVEKTSDALKDKTFVVFDLETTGTDPARDKIIEIGAAKVVNGKIAETFSCLVNPECPIPAGATNVNHITDDMVKNELRFSEVVGDFYKFTRSAILVAHNAPFDISFLTRQGLKERYDFDNSYMDTLAIAKQKLKISKYNLEYLCKHLEITLEGAHRALNDAVATAKLFIKLMNMK